MDKKIWKHSLTILALAAALGITGCQQKEKSVKIALAIPLTGDIASLGQGLRRAVVMALEEANLSGSYSYPIALVSFDDRSDPKEAVTVANRIISDPNIICVIGHFNSGCSIPASLVYARAGLPMISPASSNPDLTTQQLSPQWKWTRNIFRMNTTDNVQGSFGADFILKTLKVKETAVIHDKTAYGQGIAEEFKKEYEIYGGRVVSFEGLQVGDRDFRSLLTRVKGTGPKALYFGGMFSEGGALLRQARDIGYDGYFVAVEANYDPSFINVAGSAAEGAYVTFLGSPPELLPLAREFIARYQARYPRDEIKSYDAYGYEVASLALEALLHVGPDRNKFIDYLRQVQFNGVLGVTAFDEKGDTLNKTITLFQVKDQKFVPVDL